ncbi:Mitochondrial outer membrane transport complex Tom37 metaxin protein [Rutstroemia sp. NJR-2017a BBW]|nr:Mitochondrial outer membrane transport complex Tom37 metaxin protein [Rutstroemia sp. NJR-2017a BBW]
MSLPNGSTSSSQSAQKDNGNNQRKPDKPYNQSNFTRQTNAVKDFFSIPKPVKKVFDKVPVLTYPANELPRGPGSKGKGKADRDARLPSLYIFCREGDEAENGGRPSFNPGCLKWQTFLKLAGVDHKIVSSNNHASPTGVLPFLLPGIKSTSSQDDYLPIPSSGFVKYAKKQGRKVQEPQSMRYEAYQSLIDHRIRNAWLHTLYLTPSNFSSVAWPLYIQSTSSVPLIRLITAHQLRSAASAELMKTASTIDTHSIYGEAEKAFEALSVLLGDEKWFFGEKEPTLFDASIFAYIYLLLDDTMGWKDRKLVDMVKKSGEGNLVRHSRRVFKRCWGDISSEGDGVLV